MKSSHCEDRQKDRHLDILTDEENGLGIVVSRLGGPDQSCENKRSRPMDRLARLVWEPCWGPIIRRSARFKIRKASKQLHPATLLRAAITMTPQLASFD